MNFDDNGETKIVGRKDDKGKLRWDLLPVEQVEKIVEILTFGAEKYGANNWKKVDHFRDRYYSALMRHLASWRKGEKYDKESEKEHLAHAMTCLIFLIWGDENIG